MSTALVLADDGRRNNGRWKRGTVQDGNGHESITAWIKALNRAGFVIDHAPDLAEQVVSDELELSVAQKQAEQRRDAERHRLEREERIRAEEEDAKAFVEANAPDLAAQVGDFFQSFAEAKAVWEAYYRIR